MPEWFNCPYCRATLDHKYARCMQCGKQTTYTPLYKHDSDCCEYLGTRDGFDVYICVHQVGGPTYIARYGSEGREYVSGALFVTTGHHFNENRDGRKPHAINAIAAVVAETFLKERASANAKDDDVNASRYRSKHCGRSTCQACNDDFGKIADNRAAAPIVKGKR